MWFGVDLLISVCVLVLLVGLCVVFWFFRLGWFYLVVAVCCFFGCFGLFDFVW